MVDGSWQAGHDRTPKRRLGQTAEIEHMTIENTPMTPDKSEAEKFLATLDPSAQQFTFQTFDDNFTAFARPSLTAPSRCYGAYDENDCHDDCRCFSQKHAVLN